MKKYKNIGITILGIILIIISIWILKINSRPEGVFFTFPFICIGMGCGILGYGLSQIIHEMTLKNNSETAKLVEIEVHDERNITINNRAKAKAFDLMLYLFAGLLLIFALLNVDMIATLLLVGAYLFVVGYRFYSLWRYHKEM